MISKAKLLALLPVIFPLACIASPLPEPFSMPSNPAPGVAASCMSCRGSQQNNEAVSSEAPYLDSDGTLVMDLKLGNSPLLDTGGLFTAHLGYQMSYHPKDWYTLIPPGAPQGSKNFLIVREGPRKILFETKSGKLEDIELLSNNIPGVALRRDGDRFIVANLSAKTECVYESQDAGTTWRLSSMRRSDFPEITLKCEYAQNGDLKTIVLPGNLRYTLDCRQDGLVAKLTGPDGEITEFSWDERAMIKGLRTLLPPTHPLYPANPSEFKLKKGENLIVQDIHCECDAAGRLLSLIGSNGEKFTAEYRSDSDPKTKTASLGTILAKPDGSKTFFELVKTADGTRIIKFGDLIPGAKGGAETKDVRKEFVMKKVKNTYVTFSRKIDGVETKLGYAGDAAAESSKTDALGNTTQYTRDAKGLLSIKTYPDDSIDNYFYDDAGRLVKKTDASGRITQYEYDEKGHPLAEEYAGNVTFRRQYNEAGLPVETLQQDGTIQKLEWDAQIRLTALVNPDGTRTEWTYKGSLRTPFAKTSVSSDGKQKYSLAYSCDPQGRLTKIAYPDGTSESWKYGCCDVLEARDRDGAITKYAYDSANRKVLDISPNGGKMSYVYDARGRLVKTVRPGNLATMHEYDQTNRIVKTTQPDSTWIAYEYDKAGRKIVKTSSNGRFSNFAYDLRDRIVSITGTASDNLEYKHDQAGQTLSVTNYGLPKAETGRQTLYEYDESGRLLQTMQPDGSFEKNFYQGASNRLIATLSKGIVTRYGFDNAGRINALASYPAEDLRLCKTSEEKQSLFNNNIFEKRIYDAFGNISEIRKRVTSQSPAPALVASTDGGGFRLAARYDYSPDGQLNSILKPVSESGAEKFTYSYAFKGDGIREVSIYKKFIEHSDLSKLDYNEKLAYGCVVSKEELVVADVPGLLLSKTLEKAGQKISSINALGEKNYYEYDKAGRLSKVLDEKKELQSSYVYDKNGRLDSIVDPIGRVYKNIYGNDGRLEATQNPAGEKRIFDYNEFGRLSGKAGAGDYDLSYTYTSFEEIASYTDGNGATTKFEYNDAGKLVKRIWPDSSFVTYEYKENGLLSKKTEANRVINYFYDSTNHLVKIEIAQGAEKSMTNLRYNTDGKLVEVSDENSRIEFAYDDFGRILLEKGSIGEIKYSYDSSGRLSEKTCSFTNKLETFSTKYFYDELDRIAKVGSPAGEYSYSYDQKGRIASLAFVSVKIVNEYDKAGHLTAKNLSNVGIPSRAPILLCRYEYDKLDRRVKATVNDIAWLYKYDLKGQLTYASSSDGKSYGYNFDPIGNKLKDKIELASREFSYNNLNQIANSGFEYDKYGNLIKTTEAEYSYDLLNRLCEVRKTNVTVKYFYDPMGQRIKSEETVSGKTKITSFLMSGMVEQARVVEGKIQFHTLGLDLAGSLTATGGIGAVLASSEYSSSQSPAQHISKSFNYLYDGNGNVISTCDSEGEIIAKLAYSPFGEQITGSEIPFTFSTKVVDTSGLAYYGFRFYNPEQGRWLNRDPIEEKGGLHLYTMVRNNSINLFDILGNGWEDPVPDYGYQQSYTLADLQLEMKVVENAPECASFGKCHLVKFDPVTGPFGRAYVHLASDADLPHEMEHVSDLKKAYNAMVSYAESHQYCYKSLAKAQQVQAAMTATVGNMMEANYIYITIYRVDIPVTLPGQSPSVNDLKATAEKANASYLSSHQYLDSVYPE